MTVQKIKDTYQPREGTLADKVIGWLEVNGGSITTGQIASTFKSTNATIPRCLERSVEAGILRSYTDRNKRYYLLPPKSEHESEQDAEHAQTVARNFAIELYRNGVLSINGISSDASGTIVLRGNLAALLRGLVAGMGVTP